MLCLINWCLKHSFTARLKGRSKLVHPNSARIIRIRFAASDVGRYENTLELVFIEFESRNTFLITRKVFGTIGDPELHDRLRPEHPYTRRRGPSMNLTGKNRSLFKATSVDEDSLEREAAQVRCPTLCYRGSFWKTGRKCGAEYTEADASDAQRSDIW